MRDRTTGNCRGFGFIKFFDPKAAERVLQENEKHVIAGRMVEVKKAMPRAKQRQSHQPLNHQYANQSPSRGFNWNSTNNNRSNGNHSKLNKIFVGGLSGNITEDDFKNYFQNFGTITDVVVMYDSVTHRPRGFGFITFDSEEAVENVMQKSFHELNGKYVEVKIAVPKDGNNHSNNSNRDNNNYNSRMMGERGPVFSNYSGGIYLPYLPRYGFFPGYVPPPFYAHGSGYYGGYTVGSYDGIVYGGPSPGPSGFWNGQELGASRCSPVPNSASYPGYYVNGGSGASFPGVAAFDNKENQTNSDTNLILL